MTPVCLYVLSSEWRKTWRSMAESHARARVALLLVAVLAGIKCGGGAEPHARAAGGRGPELRSRVTQALDELQRAVAADPLDGAKWWKLGIQAQVAAGGSVPEEKVAVALLERGRQV